MPTTTRSAAEIAAQEVRNANAEADRLEARVREARDRGRVAADVAKQAARDYDGAIRRVAADVMAELDGLRNRLRTALAVNRTAQRPGSYTRKIARMFLHAGCDYGQLEQLAHGDGLFGELYAINFALVQLEKNASGRELFSESQPLFDAIDSVEIESWKAVIQRAREVAGES